MGLLDNTTQKAYYQGNDHGSYQFVSLDDIIAQFMVAYVGDDKILPRCSRTDVAFHAQRALAELSFDTFKSFKSQQIDLPPSLTMILPHDYVNYTKLSWVDPSGIKRPLYPTKHTNNPFEINQDDDGNYVFSEGQSVGLNFDFSANDGKLMPPWLHSGHYEVESVPSVVDGVLTFTHSSHTYQNTGVAHGAALAAWQAVDVSSLSYVNISATGTSAAATTTTVGATTYNIPPTTLRFGISTQPGSMDKIMLDNQYYSPMSPNAGTDIFDIAYLEWTAGSTGAKEELFVDVTNHDTIYVLVTSSAPFNEHAAPDGTLTATTTIDDLVVSDAYGATNLQPSNIDGNSSTWDSYKSITPSENNNDDYEDDTYWPLDGERYGLEPSHAQINGSFYIDDRLGKIHFSSNISGKTVILDYISDSLGTDAEMQVHKLAEDAMYKSIICDIMSTRRNANRGQLLYYKKDKFAAVRKAKLRLSNVKLEELTQVLRGKSKWIKH